MFAARGFIPAPSDGQTPGGYTPRSEADFLGLVSPVSLLFTFPENPLFVSPHKAFLVHGSLIESPRSCTTRRDPRPPKRSSEAVCVLPTLLTPGGSDSWVHFQWPSGYQDVLSN